MLGIFGCTLVASYLVAVSFAMAEMLASRHTLTRGMRAKVDLALGVVAWPAEESWLQLRQYFLGQWQQATPRWQGVAS